MQTIRRAAERGHFDFGWLDTWHAFSFGEYHAPRWMGFRTLRVLNDDVVAPGGGFPMHPHRDMEIVTYVLEGALAHEDSMGNGSVIHPGEVQRMSAGTGVVHSEVNASTADPVHLLQIWILPDRRGLAPGYEQKAFGEDARRGVLRLVASRDGRDGSVTIHQDTDVYATLLDRGAEVGHALGAERHAWVHVARGRARVNGVELLAGDAMALSEEGALTIASPDHAEVLVFDMP